MGTAPKALLELFLMCCTWLPCRQVYVLGGGWQTVATLLLAASFYLPRLPKHPFWPWVMDWNAAVFTAACFLAPFWPASWQRWMAYAGLVKFMHEWVPLVLYAYRSRRASQAQFAELRCFSEAWMAAAEHAQ
jgi:hypothetical protein